MNPSETKKIAAKMTWRTSDPSRRFLLWVRVISRNETPAMKAPNDPGQSDQFRDHRVQEGDRERGDEDELRVLLR